MSPWISEVEGWGALALAIAAILGLVTATVAFFYRRGGSEQALKQSVDDLKDTMERTNTTFANFAERLDGRIERVETRVDAHDIQLAVLRDRVNRGALIEEPK